MKKPPRFQLEPARDIWGPRHQPLDVFFHPQSVALIGATENAGSVGKTILRNLVDSPFGGTIYPVNPKRKSVMGIKAYPDIASVPEKVDLAVIVTPAPTVPDLISDCAKVGVPAAVIISAGFKETGPEGAELERQILERARSARMRIIGPNCLGVMSPHSGLNATFASTIASKGSVAFISQSGALCTAILDWSLQESVGFSAFISIGSMLDVGWGDLIDYLGDDPKTSSIVLYMETIGNARAFLSAAREVALTKPIIVIKAGQTQESAKAAASHTGSLAGSDAALRAAFKRCGVLRVNMIGDLFDMAEVLGKQPRPKGNRLTILTNAGGPGVLATDSLILGGGHLADISPETIEILNKILPAAWSHNNPIDILGDAGPDRYAQALEIAAKDPNSDGLLVILTPQAMTDPTKTAERLKAYSQIDGKPVLASWMGGDDIAKGEKMLEHSDIPTFPYPDAATRVFNYMWRYNDSIKGIYETPHAVEETEQELASREAAEQLISKVRASGRTLLTEAESKTLLKIYSIPTVETLIARTEDEAVDAAGRINYPVCLKLHSETITHKTDVGGVELNVHNEDSVRRSFNAIRESVTAKAGAEHFLGVTVQRMMKLDGYELILGSHVDPQLGPVLLFGLGGQLVEVLKDSALGLPPLNTTLARRMMEETKIFKALKGVRGRAPIDLTALERLLVRFSELVADQRWIKEIDINPLLAGPNGLIALDARVILYDGNTALEQIPRLAIRPYPTRYITKWSLRDGTPVTIRPIRPEDEPSLGQFHETLSEQSVYLRYFQMLKLSQRVAHERLTRRCFTDYDREIPLVVDYKDPASPTHKILAVGRLTKLHGIEEGEFGLLVSDGYQKQGIGTELLKRLVQVARDEKLQRIHADILLENIGMQKICERLGFQITPDTAEKTLVHASLSL